MSCGTSNTALFLFDCTKKALAALRDQLGPTAASISALITSDGRFLPHNRGRHVAHVTLSVCVRA